MKNKIQHKNLKTWGGGGDYSCLMQYGLGVLHIKEKKAFEKDKHEEEEAIEIRLGQPVQKKQSFVGVQIQKYNPQNRPWSLLSPQPYHFCIIHPCSRRSNRNTNRFIIVAHFIVVEDR